MNQMTNPSTLFHASRQWASRPDDQRFLSLTELHDTVARGRANSKATVLSTRQIEVQPANDLFVENKGLDHGYALSEFMRETVTMLEESGKLEGRTLQ